MTEENRFDNLIKNIVYRNVTVVIINDPDNCMLYGFPVLDVITAIEEYNGAKVMSRHPNFFRVHYAKNYENNKQKRKDYHQNHK